MLIESILSNALLCGFNKAEVYWLDVIDILVNIKKYDLIEYHQIKNSSYYFRGELANQYVTAYSENLNEYNIKNFLKDAIFNSQYANCCKNEIIFNRENSHLCKSVPKKAPDKQSLLCIAEILNLEIQKKQQLLIDGINTCNLFIDQCCLGYIQYNNFIENTIGLNLCRTEGFYYAITEIRVTSGDDVKSQLTLWYGNNIEKIDTISFAEESINNAISKIGAKSITTGIYNIILKNKVAVKLFQAFAPIFYAENVQSSYSLLKNKIGKKIANSIITLNDNGDTPLSPHSITFDHEGANVQNKIILENGILKNYLYNSKTSIIDNVRSTGNGFRNEDDYLIGTSVTNFYINPSDNSFQDLLFNGDSILITEMEDIDVGINLYNGDFSISASGFNVAKGYICNPINNIIINSNFYDLLYKIDMIDSNIYFTLPDNISSIGMPNLFVRDVAISGFG